MPRRSTTRFTINTVKGLKAPDPSGMQKLYWDADLIGFGVLCSGKTNGKTYVVQRNVNGKSRRVTIGSTKAFTLSEARDRAIKLLAKMYDGIDPKAERRASRASGLKLGQVLEDYLADNKGLREKTAADYRATVHRYLSDWLDLSLKEIDRDMVKERHLQIQEAVAKNKRRDATGHSAANGTMRVLRLIWNYAKELNQDLPDNPVTRLSRVKAWFPENRRDSIVRDSDLPVFYEAVTNLKNTVQRDYILLMLFTGLRRSEAAALTWDEADLEERVIRLPRARTKDGRRLDLPMSDFVYELLLAQRDLRSNERWVFPAESKSGHVEEPRFALDIVAEKTGLYVRPHDLRRTFITIARRCRLSEYDLKGLVNHSLGGDVTAGYVIDSWEDLREPMQIVTGHLLEKIGRVQLVDRQTSPEGAEVASDVNA